jgi:tetratricopeptide (TPR) repeat protein
MTRVWPHILFCLCLGITADAQDHARSSSAGLRNNFNAAAAKLREGKLRETESLLEGVLASQDESLRPSALYNLGHARFAMGIEELKKSEQGRPTAARGSAAAMEAEAAASDGRDALRGNDFPRLLGSYMLGRGALKDLRGSIKTVMRALQFHAAALNRWERASSDWKSAYELDPRNQDARHNAEVADQHIARLIDSIRELQKSLLAMQAARDQLKDAMRQIRGRIPEPNMPPGAPGDEEEDDDEGAPHLPPPGQSEAPSQEGEERPMTPEEAGWILEGFKSGEERRLPMGQEKETQPKDRNRRTW